MAPHGGLLMPRELSGGLEASPSPNALEGTELSRPELSSPAAPPAEEPEASCSSPLLVALCAERGRAARRVPLEEEGRRVAMVLELAFVARLRPIDVRLCELLTGPGPGPKAGLRVAGAPGPPTRREERRPMRSPRLYVEL